jgi:iron complex outermembrane receptor protein
VVDGIGLARPSEMNGDLGDVERIEILRGPQGTLFGKNATAGVISIVNKRPTRELDGFADVEGAKDEYVVRAAIGGPITDSVRARLFVYKRHLDSLVQNINTEPGASDSMNSESHGGAGKLEFDFGSDVNLLLSGNWSEVNVNVPVMVYIVQPGYGLRESPVLPGDRYHINRDGDSSYIPTKTYGASSDLTWSINDRWTFKSLTGFAESQQNNYQDYDFGKCGPQDDGKACIAEQGGFASIGATQPRAPSQTNRISDEMRLEYKGAVLDSVAGIYGDRVNDHIINHSPGALVDRNHDNVFDLLSDKARNSGTRNHSYAAFGDLTEHLTDTFSLFQGARYTNETIEVNHLVNIVGTALPQGGPLTSSLTYTRLNGTVIVVPDVVSSPVNVSAATAPQVTNFRISQTFTNVSARGGFSWAPHPNQNFYASIARGYKGPSAGLSATAVAATAIVDPEIALGEEAGFKGRFFDNRLDLSVALFHTTIDHLQQTTTIPGTLDTELINIGNMRTQGFEIESTALVAPQFTVSSSLAFVDAKMTSGLFHCYIGQTAAQGCNVLVPGSTTPLESLDGKPLNDSPRWKYRMAGNYEVQLPGIPIKAYAQLAWVYRSRVQYEFDQTPQTILGGYGLLDATVGLTDSSGRYLLEFFGKNLMDKWHPASLAEFSGIGLATFVPARDADRYFGARFQVNIR